jgi:hypothetical protein
MRGSPRPVTARTGISAVRQEGGDVGFDLGVLGTIAVAAAFLIVVMRWVFAPSRPRTGRPDRGPNANLGLLVPVVSEATRANALKAKNHLSGQGIRCSVSRLDRDSYDVLVFEPDAEKAAKLLGD